MHLSKKKKSPSLISDSDAVLLFFFSLSSLKFVRENNSQS
jgi:hypothetical protein